MIVSIIIPSYRRHLLLRVGLLSIAAQNIKYDYEIIVLNDGIIDGTAEVCMEFPQLNIRHIFTGQRNLKGLQWRCPSYALNIGIKQAKGKYLLLTSPEIYYLTPNCINNMIENALDPENEQQMIVPGKGYDDQVGVITKQLLHGEKIDIKEASIDNLNIQFPFSLIVEKQILMDIGGYDEDFTGYCYDDADLIRRLHIYGCRYCIVSGEKIIHLYHGSRKIREGLTDKTKKLNHNCKLYEDKKDEVIRNVDKEWGVL